MPASRHARIVWLLGRLDNDVGVFEVLGLLGVDELPSTKRPADRPRALLGRGAWLSH